MLAVVGWLAVDFGLRLPGSKYIGLDPTTAHDAMVSVLSETAPVDWSQFRQLAVAAAAS
jgi:hypothetical protein